MRKEYRQRHRGEEPGPVLQWLCPRTIGDNVWSPPSPLGRGGDVFIFMAPRSRKRTGCVVPALPRSCCVALDKSRPSPEPGFPHLKAKSVSRRLLFSVVAGVMTSI